MEGTPTHLDLEEIRRSLRALPGVADVHDLHLWSLGGSSPLLTAHLVVDLTVRAHEILRAATAALAARYGIEHVTLQIERPDFNIHGIGTRPVDAGKTSP
jgi:cobalt-zinc-cadmium efflux system protein